MATRAVRQTQFSIVKSYPVDASQTVTIGKPVVFSTDESHIKDASSGTGVATSFGVAVRCSDGSTGLSGSIVSPPGYVDVALFGSGAVVPMIVGTGGCTAGKRQVMASDGITDCATPAASGSTVNETVGIALQTGVVGDIVGVAIARGTHIST